MMIDTVNASRICSIGVKQNCIEQCHNKNMDNCHLSDTIDTIVYQNTLENDMDFLDSLFRYIHLRDYFCYCFSKSNQVYSSVVTLSDKKRRLLTDSLNDVIGPITSYKIIDIRRNLEQTYLIYHPILCLLPPLCQFISWCSDDDPIHRGSVLKDLNGFITYGCGRHKYDVGIA